MKPTAEILVAIDGSPESTAALTWAAQQAQVSAHALRLVHVVEYLPGYGYVWASTVGARTALEDSGGRILADARAFARELFPTVPVRASTMTGAVTQTLLAECDRASLAVVGARGAGAFSRLLVGSVSSRLATHASCPVVIVDEPVGAPGGRPGSTPVERVVVGVGGTHDTGALVDFAFTEAERHGVPLVAIRTWEPPESPVAFRRLHDVDIDYCADRDEYERDQLLRAIASTRAAHPRVRVTARVRIGGVAARLTRACHPRDLLVIGHRHSGRFYPPALGAAASAVTHHARCPLAVVPIDASARIPATLPATAGRK